ncbi:MAG: hypothetical protein QXT69_04215 [Fervidicoccaceae archaeon]
MLKAFILFPDVPQEVEGLAGGERGGIECLVNSPVNTPPFHVELLELLLPITLTPLYFIWKALFIDGEEEALSMSLYKLQILILE